MACELFGTLRRSNAPFSYTKMSDEEVKQPGKENRISSDHCKATFSRNNNTKVQHIIQRLLMEAILLTNLREYCPTTVLVAFVKSSGCRNPEYAHINDRYRSFATWQYGHIQDVKSLAEAGFYFTANDDSVRCFMCNGGLCNWEDTDIPWYEHARWFGNCLYVQHCRQNEVVAAIIDTVQQITESRQARFHDRHSHHQHQNGNTQCDGSTATSHTNLREDALNMGFATDKVERALKAQGNQKDVPMYKLVDALHDPDITSSGRKESLPMSDSAHLTTSFCEKVTECKREEAENDSLKSSVTCKVCLERRVGVIFLPCSHLVCCLDCGLQLDKCPLCRGHIKATAAVHL